jgi:muramidase (phage lysozyme)
MTIGDPFASYGPEQLKKVEQLRDLIASVESEAGADKGSGYTKLVGGKDQPNLTEMTLEQVMALQQEMVKQGSSGATGRYQVIPETLKMIVDQMRDVDKSKQKFDQAFQDRVANVLIARRGYRDYAADPNNRAVKEQLLKELNKEWRGLPNRPGMQRGDKSDPEATDPNLSPADRAKYKNKAGVGWDEAIQSFAKGGIANMPDTGGLANLHGNEAVVPLPDGRTIPVVIKNDFSDLRREQQPQIDMEMLTRVITAAMQNAANSITNNLQMQPILTALNDISNYQRQNVNVNERMLRNHVG